MCLVILLRTIKCFATYNMKSVHQFVWQPHTTLYLVLSTQYLVKEQPLCLAFDSFILSEISLYWNGHLLFMHKKSVTSEFLKFVNITHLNKYSSPLRITYIYIFWKSKKKWSTLWDSVSHYMGKLLYFCLNILSGNCFFLSHSCEYKQFLIKNFSQHTYLCGKGFW